MEVPVPDSVRKQILLSMQAAFAAVAPPDPADETHVPSIDDWPFKFSVVGLGPLSDADHRKRYSIGVVPQRERYKDSFPYQERFLRVGLEFRVTVNQGDDDPALMAEDLLTVIERVVSGNKTWDELAIETRLQDNEVDMTTYGDKTVMGVLFVEVQYRHGHLDPRNPLPDP